MKNLMAVVTGILVSLVIWCSVFGIIISLVGCCPSEPAVPDRFEVLIDQKVHSERHQNFSIMVIKDKTKDKEFKIIYNSSWGVVVDE